MDDVNKLMLDLGIECFCGPIQHSKIANLIETGGYAGAKRAMIKAAGANCKGLQHQLNFAAAVVCNEKAKSMLADTRLNEADDQRQKRQRKIDQDRRQLWDRRAQQQAHDVDVARVMDNAEQMGLVPNLIAKFKVTFPMFREVTTANLAFREWVWNGVKVK